MLRNSGQYVANKDLTRFLKKGDDMTMILTDTVEDIMESGRNYKQEKHEEATEMIQMS